MPAVLPHLLLTGAVLTAATECGTVTHRYLPPGLLRELGVTGFHPTPDPSSSESDSEEDELDAQEAHDRELTSKFMGQRARWKLFHKYRNVDRAYPSEHVWHTCLWFVCLQRLSLY